MAGIYGIYAPGAELPSGSYRRMFSAPLPHTDNDEWQSGDFVAGRSVTDRFEEDRALEEEGELVVGLEGLLYNRGERSAAGMVREAWEEGEDFPGALEGLFSGFVLDRARSELCLFTDPLATRPLYYLCQPGRRALLFGSELKWVTGTAREMGLPLGVSADAFRCLLSFGYMLDGLTPAGEVRKVPPGTVLSFDLQDFTSTERRWFALEKSPQSLGLAEALEEADRLLRRAVEREWEKDRQNGYRHLALLSGGLDSRANVMLADELGFENLHTLTFSRAGTSDQAVARQIAGDRGYTHRFVDLEEGGYLTSGLERYLEAGDGLTALNGAAHMIHALQNLDLEGFGALHSGQIGDVLFGSFTGLRAKLRDRPGSLGFLDAPEIIERISIWPELRERYLQGAPELFAWEQRQVNGTLNGDRSVAHWIDMPSPFYDRELIRFCLSLPEELRRGEKLYTEWMRRRHPEMARYRWQKAGTRIRRPLPMKLFGLAAKARRHLLAGLGLPGDEMTPLAWWMRRNARIPEVLTGLFNDHIAEVDEPELREEARQVFGRPEAQAKFNALTAVLSYRLHLKS
ncbi:MAG: asparagine synthase-related protein [Balneolaceae bacterium]|nr:asparagine synthase-related protein [Balneolaceae bacterium]